MTTERQPDGIDRRLRDGLEPEAGASRRVAAAALAARSRRPNRPRPLAAFGAVATLLIATLALSLWWRAPKEPPAAPAAPAVTQPIRIANFGELIAVVDPQGSTWLHGPRRPVAAGSPRMIVRLGGTDEN